jgi:hypothetical protein
LIIDRIVEILNKSNTSNLDQIKGCLHTLCGDNTFFLPTKHSWAMKEKIWPAIARMAQTTEISINNLIQNIQKDMYEIYFTHVIIQRTDELAKNTAAALWHPLELSEIEKRQRSNENDASSYRNLMEALNSLLQNDKL